MGSVSLSVACEVANRNGVQHAPVLIRSGFNDVYRIGDLVVRVAGVGVDVDRDIAIGAFLKLAGVPVPDAIEAGQTHGFSYSVWEYLSSHEPEPIDFRSFGSSIRALHDLGVDSFADFGLPWCDELEWLNVDSKLGEVRSAQALPDEDLRLLEGHAARLRSWGDQCRAASRRVVCHGDVHPQNVIMRDGKAVVIDWDTICVGPPQWDHAALMTWSERWGGAESDYNDFADGYGDSFGTDPLATMLAEVRLLAPTVNMLLRAADDPRFAAEAELRMRYWRNDPGSPSWSPQ